MLRPTRPGAPSLPTLLTSLVLLLPGVAGVSAQRAPAVSEGVASAAARVDSLFAEWDGLDRPGVAVAVLRNGRIVLERGYGSAQIEHRAPITPATVFHVASVTKQFVAFGIALLAERGRLTLNDELRTHLPEFAVLHAPVTLRQLLHHTSGIRDQWELLAMAGWRLDDVITREQVLGLVERQRELNFPPGSEYVYSNTGYTLLAEVVSRVGGRPFPGWLAENVFRPLEMTSTHVHVDHEHLVPGRAYSYSPAGDDTDAEWEKSVLSYAVAGATSLFTTAGDLARWLRNFETAEVGGPAAIRRMQERGVLADGDTISYALGIRRGRYRGLETWGHSGGDAGFRSHVLRIPAEELGVVVLSNASTFVPGRMARRVADVYLDLDEPAIGAGPDRPEVDAAAPDSAPDLRLADHVLADYVGRYDVERVGILTVEPEGEGLILDAGGPPLPMLALSDTSFHVPDGGIRVLFRREDDRVSGLVIPTSSGRLEGPRLETVELGTAELRSYMGLYYSPEIETLYRLAVDDGRLVARHKRHGDLLLESAGPDLFTGPRWFFRKVEFTRTEEGEVDGFRLTGGRVRDLRFLRLTGAAEDLLDPEGSP